MHRLGNPLSIACPNKSCRAGVGAPCRTPGGHVNAHAHMPRIRAVASSSDGEIRKADRTYLAQVLEELIGRAPTDAELGRAARDGTLRTDRGWLHDLIEERGRKRRPMTRRQNPNGTLTLWGAVVHEQQLPSGSWLLKLDSGETVGLTHDDAWRWAEWWPERKGEALEELGEGVTPRYQFELTPRGQVTAISIVGAADLVPAPRPAARPDPQQMELL